MKPVAKPKVWSVSQINSYIRSIIEGDILLHSFFAQGEISNCKCHSSGHIYFTLKDEKAAVNAVMFKSYADGIMFKPKDGMKVIVCGYISVYEKNGQYQLYAEMMEPLGKGKLYTAFEQLKEQLYREGLFDEANKKEIPFFPRCVAVITSPTGAAVRDIIQIIRRRNPAVKVCIYPISVQGENAPSEIVSAVKTVNVWGKADVIILGRGGGSIEDLWAFNNEMVARTVAASKIPLISAVGHETDFTIVDFVSDLRAPTPSAAAELAVPDLYALRQVYTHTVRRLSEAFTERNAVQVNRLNCLLRRNVFSNPKTIAEIKKNYLSNIFLQMQQLMDKRLENYGVRLRTTLKSVENMSPVRVVGRGYTMVTDNLGNVVPDVETLNKNDVINITFRDGKVSARVTEIDSSIV